MKSFTKFAVPTLLVLLLFAQSAVWAQQPKPTTRPPKSATPKAATPKAPPKPRPTPPAHSDTPAAPPVHHDDNPPPPPPAPVVKPAEEPPAEPIQPLLEANPAVREAYEMERKEPRDYVQSILLLVDLGRPELAKPIMTDLMKLQVSDEQRVAIVKEFGGQGMLHLSRAKELAPNGATFADACMAAASAAGNNPERIAALVKQLSDASPENRTTARNDLSATGEVGAKAALEALARETDPARRSAILAAVELMHPLVDRPLLAMLNTSDLNLRSAVVTLLQRLAVPQAAPFLMADTAAAEKAMSTAISNYEHGSPPFAVDEANQVEMWTWDDAGKQLSFAHVPADEAQTIWIARLADELARIRPDNNADQQKALVLRLEAAGLTAKPNSPPAIPRLSQADPRALSAALGEALKKNYSHAALALVEAIAQQPDADILLSSDGKPSPLADALNSPNRRVRFAALKAIMALNPATPYPGSSRVPDALDWFAGSTGEHQAVVAMPTNAVAGDIAGKLAEHKLVGEATNRGHETVELARSSPDLEMVLVDMDILLPDTREVVYQLRITPATGAVPIAILAADGRLDAAKRLAADHTRVIAVPRPHTPEAFTHIVDQLTNLAARDEVPAAERARQAEQAKKWLATISAGNRPFYTFRRLPMLTAAEPQPHVAAPEAIPIP